MAFDIPIDKDIIRRVLASHYRPEQGSDGPSWLTFIGHLKDSLWSIDLFRCESATLRTHWILVVMDQYTRRIIGFGVHAGVVDGIALCRMFNQAIRGCRAIGREIRNRALRVATLTLNQVKGETMFCTEFTAPTKKEKRSKKERKVTATNFGLANTYKVGRGGLSTLMLPCSTLNALS